MPRRLITLLALAFVLLSTGTIGLAIRSFRVHDRLSIGTRHNLFLVHSVGGVIVLFDTDQYADFMALRVDWDHGPAATGPTPAAFAGDAIRSVTGFSYRRGYASAPGWSLEFPHWIVAALLALPPAVLAYAGRRRPGVARCKQCGYDLRATPDRCPECGTIAVT